MHAKQALLFAALANSHTPFADFIGLMSSDYPRSRWKGALKAWKILQNVSILIRGLQRDRRAILTTNGRWAFGPQVVADSLEFSAGLTRLRCAIFLRTFVGLDQCLAAKVEIDALLVGIERASLYATQYPEPRQ